MPVPLGDLIPLMTFRNESFDSFYFWKKTHQMESGQGNPRKTPWEGGSGLNLPEKTIFPKQGVEQLFLAWWRVRKMDRQVSGLADMPDKLSLISRIDTVEVENSSKLSFDLHECPSPINK